METEGENPPAAPPKAPGPESALARIVGTFVSPVRTFGAIAARPTFLAPLVLWCSLSFLVGQIVVPRTDWRAVIAEASAKREPRLTDAQLDGAAETYKKLAWVWEGISLVIPALIAVVVAGAIWIGCQAFGWELRFKQGFGVTVHAFLPAILASVPLFAILWGRTTIDPNGLDDVLPTNLGFLVSRQTDKGLHTLLTAFDLLSLWTFVLLVLGFSAATRAPRARVAILVGSLWFLFVFGRYGLGMLFS
jgi:hypothetical protein